MRQLLSICSHVCTRWTLEAGVKPFTPGNQPAPTIPY
jgi:hypothetical protein